MLMLGPLIEEDDLSISADLSYDRFWRILRFNSKNVNDSKLLPFWFHKLNFKISLLIIDFEFLHISCL